MSRDTKRIDTASGRFVLRIGSELHRLLRRAAAEARLSLNEYCRFKLMAPSTTPGGEGVLALERASEFFSEDLVALAIFGSWARGAAVAESDIDLLVVVDETVGISRDLYRCWDRSPLHWEGHFLQPHFVHLPPPGESISGTWAEVALDGIVLFQRGLLLSRHLIEVRRAIAAGSILRKEIHGQSYWTEGS